MFKVKRSALVAYAIVGCLTNLQFAAAQESLSTNTESYELEKPKMIKRVRPSGYDLPINGEALFSAGYAYGDSSVKTSTGFSYALSQSQFTVTSAYGFSRNLFAGIEISVAQGVTKEKNNALTFKNETTATSEGMKNPKLQLGIQFPRNPMTIVLGSELSLNVEAPKSETGPDGNTTSNVASGNSLAPYVLVHNNSRRFLFGGKLGYEIKDKEVDTQTNQTQITGMNNISQTIQSESTTTRTGGNTLQATVFMQLPQFYNAGLRVGVLSSEKTKSTNSISNQTTISDGADIIATEAYASFGINDNLAIAPAMGYKTFLTKPGGFDSGSTISGRISLGMSF